MFLLSVTFELSSKIQLLEISERPVVEEFRLFVFERFISSLSFRFEFLTSIVPIKKFSQLLGELSWVVLWLHSWFNEWMLFFLVQRLAKWPLFPQLLQVLPYAGQLPLLCVPEPNLHFMMISGFGFRSRDICKVFETYKFGRFQDFL